MTGNKLNVDLDEVVAAMDQLERDLIDFYLDKQTGHVVVIGEEFLDGELHDEEEGGAETPAWCLDSRDLGRRIREDEAQEQFVRIPELDRGRSFRLMEGFIDLVASPRLRQKLQTAINGRGAFRRFKDVLLDHPQVRQHWFDYELEQKRNFAREWLESIEIESAWEPPVRAGRQTECQAEIVGLHHIQITIPRGMEEQAREFYCQVLGLKELEKQHELSDRGGFWLALGDIQIHVGVEDGVRREETKAHLAYEVTYLSKWEDRLHKAGIRTLDTLTIAGYKRLEFRDPFGNRVELIQPEV